MLIKPIVVVTTLLTAASTSAQEERAPIISFQNGEIKATIEFNVPGVAYDKSPVAIDDYYSTGEATFFNAQQVNDNTNNNGILLDFVNGFGDMANVVFSEMYNGNGEKRSMGLPGDIYNYNNGGRKLINNRKLQSMEPVEVTNIPCPTTLSYPIPTGGENKCLNFHVKIDAGTMSMADATTFENLINSAIDDGYLYDFVLAESEEETNISGLGDPGKGFDFENENEGEVVPANLFEEDETTEAPPITTEQAAGVEEMIEDETTTTTTTEAPILDVEGEEELGPVIPDVEETTTTIAPDEPDTDESEEAPPVACTMELFVCPDGSTVGRGGPDCEFPECPEDESGEEEDQEEYPVEEIEPDTPPELAVACTLDVKICPDGTALSREGVDCEFPECPAIESATTETQTAGKSGKSGTKSMKSGKVASKSQDNAFSKSAKKQKTGHEMLVADAKAEKMKEASSKAFKTKTAKKGADMSIPSTKSSKGKGLSMPGMPVKKGKSEKMNDGTTTKKVDAKATKKGGDDGSSSKSGKGEVVVDAKATKMNMPSSAKSSKTLFAKSSKGSSAKSTKKLGSKAMHKQAHSMPTRRLRG